MFAVKVLAIIIVLQMLHNSQCFPHGGLSGLGTYFGIANGLLSLISKQARTIDEDSPPSQADTVPYIDVLNFDDIKPDETTPSPVNCSTNCVRKTFKELVFINKLVQSMDSMYGNINDRLNEITLDTGRAKRSTSQQNTQDVKTQHKEHAKRSQENPDPIDSTTESKFYPEYGVAYNHFASLYLGLRRTFLHIKIEIPSSPPYVHLQPLNRSDCVDMYERLRLLNSMVTEKGYITMCEESFDTLSLFRDQYQRLYVQAEDLIHSKFHHFLPKDIISWTKFTLKSNRTKRGLPGLALAGTMFGVANGIMGLVGKAVNAKAIDEKFNALVVATEDLLKFTIILANNDIAINNDLSICSGSLL